MDVDPIKAVVEDQILLHLRKCGVLTSKRYSWERHEWNHPKYIVFEEANGRELLKRRILLQLTLKADHVLIEADIAPNRLSEVIGAQSDDYQLRSQAHYDDPMLLRLIKESIQSTIYK